MARATALPLPVPPTLALALTLTLLVLSAATAAAAAANDGNKPDRALLALDRVVSGALVAGRNATVEYVVANVGAGYVFCCSHARPFYIAYSMRSDARASVC